MKCAGDGQCLLIRNCGLFVRGSNKSRGLWAFAGTRCEAVPSVGRAPTSPIFHQMPPPTQNRILLKGGTVVRSQAPRSSLSAAATATIARTTPVCKPRVGASHNAISSHTGVLAVHCAAMSPPVHRGQQSCSGRQCASALRDDDVYRDAVLRRATSRHCYMREAYAYAPPHRHRGGRSVVTAITVTAPAAG